MKVFNGFLVLFLFTSNCQVTVPKQTFNPKNYCISSITLTKQNILNQTVSPQFQYFNHTLPATMSNTNYDLAISISELDSSMDICKIQYSSKSISSISITLIEVPSSENYRCSFTLLMADALEQHFISFPHVNIDLTTPNTSTTPPSYPIPSNVCSMIPKFAIIYNITFVQHFKTNGSQVNFYIQVKSSTSLTLGDNHTLTNLTISLILVDLKYMTYFVTDQFTISQTVKSYHWDNDTTLLTVIGLKGLKGQSPSINYSCASSGDCNLFDATTFSISFTKIQPLLQKCATQSNDTGSACAVWIGYYPSTVYPSAINKCSDFCLACYAPYKSNCSSCNSPRTLINDQCFCMERYYEQHLTCKKCQSKCLKCTNSTICLQCELNNELKTPDSNCTCIQGLVEQSKSNSTCVTCSGACLSCSMISTNCSSCNSSQFRSLIGSVCVCSTGYYEQQGNSVCQPCPKRCLTCSDASSCLSCNSSLKRLLTNSQCTCQPKFYEQPKTEMCEACLLTCESCSSALTCIKCNNSHHRLLKNFTCVCDNGYYNKETVADCQNCHKTCKTCINETVCLSCVNLQFRQLSNLSCICMSGYFQQEGKEQCLVCIKPCKTCSTSSICLSCQQGAGYLLSEGRCLPNYKSPTIKIYKQNLNVVTVIINFHFKVNIRHSDQTVLLIKIDGVEIPIKIQQVNSNDITFNFVVKNPGQKLTAQFHNGTITDMKTNSVLSFKELTLDINSVYFYDEGEVKFLKAVDAVVQKASDVVTYSRIGGVMFKLVHVFIDLVQYVHQVSFYIFLDCNLPSNLRQMFSTLYNLLQYNILPINTNNIPGQDFEDFEKSEIFRKQNFSFNFINNCFMLIIQIFGTVVMYIFIGKIFSKIKSKSSCVQFFKSNFARTIYSNCIDVLSASQLPLCFASTVAIIDRKFTHPIKVANFALGIFFAFIVSFIPLINPFFLYSLRNNRKIDTQSSYAQTVKHGKLSEHYLFSKAVLHFCVGVFVPLSPAYVALILLLLACIFHLFFSSKTEFKSMTDRIIRLLYIFSNTIMHILLVTLVLPLPFSVKIQISIGYAIIILILFNILIDAIEVLFNVLTMLYNLLKKYRGKTAEIAPSNKKINISIKKKTQIVKCQMVTEQKHLFFKSDQNEDNFQKIDVVESFEQPKKTVKIKRRQVYFAETSRQNDITRTRKIVFLKRYGGGTQNQQKKSNEPTVKLPFQKNSTQKRIKTSPKLMPRDVFYPVFKK